MTGATTRLTPLAVTALALLEEGAMHPYEMLQRLLVRGKSAMFVIKPPSLYHVVGRLAETGLIAIATTEREGNRPERTVYELTESGRSAYVRWVRERLAAPATPQEYAVALAEAHNLDRDEVRVILDRRAGTLADDVDAEGERLRGARAKGVPAAYLIEIERRLVLLEADLAFTVDLLRRLDDGELEWVGNHPASTRATGAAGRTPRS